MTDTAPEVPADDIPQFVQDDGIGTILLQRPARHNRIEAADIVALNRHLDCIEAAPEIRALILTATGPSFCSGFDLRLFVETADDSSGPLGAQRDFARLVDRIEALPLPTLCALNGSVFGGATDLALACDFRIGVTGARMRMPAGRLGIHYYPTGLRRYVSRLGLSGAKRLVLAGEDFDSAGMVSIGFLDRLTDPADLGAEAHAFARHLAGVAPRAFAGMKADLHDIAYARLDQDAAMAAFLDSMSGDEIAEGLAAWQDRRAPKFTGRDCRRSEDI